MTPAAMSPSELAEAVEEIARDAPRWLGPMQVEMLWLAARRVKELAQAREVGQFYRETIEELSQRNREENGVSRSQAEVAG